MNDQNIEVVESTKLLGTVISNDLKWDLNTNQIVKKANARMQLLDKASNFGAPLRDMKDIYNDRGRGLSYRAVTSQG